MMKRRNVSEIIINYYDYEAIRFRGQKIATNVLSKETKTSVAPYESIITSDRQRQSHELPVSSFFLLISVVAHFQRRRIVRACWHSGDVDLSV